MTVILSVLFNCKLRKYLRTISAYLFFELLIFFEATLPLDQLCFFSFYYKQRLDYLYEKNQYAVFWITNGFKEIFIKIQLF